MRCPFCHHMESHVVDSRIVQEGSSTRRRRECQVCEKRFTTYERIEQSLPWIIKRDGRREPFDREKVFAGLKQACVKRPISLTQIEEMIDELKHFLVEVGEKEVPSSLVGEQVIEALRKQDRVAYVRFASVYRQFRDVDEFMEELSKLLETPRSVASRRKPPAS